MKIINLKLDMELDLVEVEREPVLITAMHFGDTEPVMTKVKLKEVLDNVVNMSKNQVSGVLEQEDKENILSILNSINKMTDSYRELINKM